MTTNNWYTEEDYDIFVEVEMNGDVPKFILTSYEHDFTEEVSSFKDLANLMVNYYPFNFDDTLEIYIYDRSVDILMNHFYKDHKQFMKNASYQFIFLYSLAMIDNQKKMIDFIKIKDETFKRILMEVFGQVNLFSYDLYKEFKRCFINQDISIGTVRKFWICCNKYGIDTSINEEFMKSILYLQKIEDIYLEHNNIPLSLDTDVIETVLFFVKTLTVDGFGYHDNEFLLNHEIRYNERGNFNTIHCLYHILQNNRSDMLNILYDCKKQAQEQGITIERVLLNQALLCMMDNEELKKKYFDGCTDDTKNLIHLYELNKNECRHVMNQLKEKLNSFEMEFFFFKNRFELKKALNYFTCSRYQRQHIGICNLINYNSIIHSFEDGQINIFGLTIDDLQILVLYDVYEGFSYVLKTDDAIEYKSLIDRITNIIEDSFSILP